MVKKGLWIFILSTLFGSLHSFAENKPPEIYIDKGACPFECCIYREWGVIKDSIIFDKPNGSIKVGRIRKGDRVQAISGNVYTWPTVLRITRPWDRYRKNDRIYLLTEKGEGIWKIWFKGRIYEEMVGAELSEDTNGSGYKFAKIEKMGKTEWWVEVKLSNGMFGWTKEDDQFVGHDMDQCG